MLPDPYLLLLVSVMAMVGMYDSLVNSFTKPGCEALRVPEGCATKGMTSCCCVALPQDHGAHQTDQLNLIITIVKALRETRRDVPLNFNSQQQLNREFTRTVAYQTESGHL